MKRTSLIFVAVWLLFFLNSCRQKKAELTSEAIKTETSSRNLTKVEIKDLIIDSTLNVRAIELSDKFLVGITSLGKKIFYGLEESDSLLLLETVGNSNSRASALVNDTFFHLSIESPAKLYKDGMMVYFEDHPKAFYDSLDFWNHQEGIAIGDPTEGCISIIITRDGGDNWSKLPCFMLPEAKEGEAAFAASDTNIAIVGNKTWIATGGMASRILYSPDKGKTWTVFDTPIMQGKKTTGIYSIDFYDSENGFAIGGDYTEPNINIANKIKTSDGGKTWKTVADGKNPGYRSCVQYIPNGNAEELVASGFEGIDYTGDSGETWTHLSDEGFYTIRFLNDSVAYAAGKGRVSKLIFR